MDLLTPVVRTWDDHELELFCEWHTQHFNAPKELQLVNLIAAKPRLTSREIEFQLYNDYDHNDAYKSSRKRLLSSISEYLVSALMASDHTGVSSAFGSYTIGAYLLGKCRPKVALALLRRAEQMATESRKYDLVMLIHGYYVRNFEALDLDLDAVLDIAKANRAKYDSLFELQTKHAKLRKELLVSKLNGVPLEAQSKVKQIIRSIHLSREEANDPVFVLEYVSIVRSAILSGKDYIDFERFSKKVYRRMKSANLFTEMDLEYEIMFLFYIAHALYRNRKFGEMKEWLGNLDNMMPRDICKTFSIYPKVISLDAAAACYTGDNRRAIEILETALNDQYMSADTSEVLNMKLNLAVYYFHENDFKAANRLLHDIGSKNRSLEKLMGREWRFKKEMIEIIVQYELGNDDIARDRMMKMKKHYDEFLKHPVYERARVFLNIITNVLNNSVKITSPDFRALVKNAQLEWPGQKEDIQAITFFCWLLSKMMKRPYYEMLKERIVSGVEFE